MPLALEDFPSQVADAISIHSQLPDRYATTDLGLLYIGKDYMPFPMFCRYANILPTQEELVLQIVQLIDAKAVKRSSDAHQKAANKLKAKARK